MPFDIQKTLLLEVDVQNDFCPAYTSSSGEKKGEGALAVRTGDEVIAPLNSLAGAIAAKGGLVAASQDWHPAGHVSFATSHAGKNAGDTVDLPAVKGQVLWPGHCVQGTWGAAFHEKLDLRPINLIIRKGFRTNLDSYSAFFENDRKTPTGLEAWLRGIGVERLIIGGLATDYCVFYSAMDAVNLGFQTIIASDAARGVDYPVGSIDRAVETMKKSGVAFALSTELLWDIHR